MGPGGNLEGNLGGILGGNLEGERPMIGPGLKKGGCVCFFVLWILIPCSEKDLNV